MSGLAGHLAVGDLPGPIIGAVTRGRAGLRPAEAADLGLAVAYRRAATPGGYEVRGALIRVDDAHPAQTLASWFGVSRKTVQAWVRANHPLVLPPGPIDPEMLVNRVRAAGERYRSGGRSAAAVAARTVRLSK